MQCPNPHVCLVRAVLTLDTALPRDVVVRIESGSFYLSLIASDQACALWLRGAGALS